MLRTWEQTGGQTMKTTNQIQQEIQQELTTKQQYLQQHPTGIGQNGDFYCNTKLNLLYAELAQQQRKTPEQIQQTYEAKMNTNKILETFQTHMIIIVIYIMIITAAAYVAKHIAATPESIILNIILLNLIYESVHKARKDTK
jgi:hypothetical protein